MAIPEYRRSQAIERWQEACEALKPAAEKEIIALVLRLARAGFAMPAAFEVGGAQEYAYTLRNQSSVIVRAAVERWIDGTNPFFPMPGQLLEICKDCREPLERQLAAARDPVTYRSKVQLMAERRVMYGEFTSALDTEWMLWHLGTAPPVPPPPEHLSAEARGAIEMQTRAEWEAEQQRLAAVLEEAKRINRREGLPQMPFDQWSRERRGADAVAAILNRWRTTEPTSPRGADND
jgi:hypothetical protein